MKKSKNIPLTKFPSSKYNIRRVLKLKERKENKTSSV
jgi:hypothetical protein